MALVAKINDSTRVAIESVAGTAPATGYRELQSTSFKPMTDAELQKFKPQGFRFTTTAIETREWSAASIAGIPDFNELHLLFDLIKKAAPALEAGATDAYKRTYAPSHNAPNTKDTLTTQTINGALIEQASYGTLEAFNLKGDISKSELGGNILFRQVLDSINDSLSAGTLAGGTPPAQVPISSAYWKVYMEDTAAALSGATALGGGALPFAYEFLLSALSGAVFGLDGILTFAETIEIDPTSQLKVTMAYGSVALGLKQTMRNGSKKFIRIEAVGPEIEVGHDYKLTMDFCVLVTAKPDDNENQGAKAMTWTFDIAYDATWGKAYQIDLINAVA